MLLTLGSIFFFLHLLLLHLLPQLPLLLVLLLRLLLLLLLLPVLIATTATATITPAGCITIAMIANVSRYCCEVEAHYAYGQRYDCATGIVLFDVLTSALSFLLSKFCCHPG